MVSNGNGETRKTLSSLAKEINENRVSIEVLKTEIQQTNMVHKRPAQTNSKTTYKKHV